MSEDPSRLFVSSRATAVPKASRDESELVELIWQDGQIVMQSQNHNNNSDRSLPKKPLFISNGNQDQIGGSNKDDDDDDDHHHHHQELWIQEEEVASWLHYPLDDYDPSLGTSDVLEKVAAEPRDEVRRSAVERTVVDSSATAPVRLVREELGCCEATAATTAGTSEEDGSEEGAAEAGRVPGGERKRKGREEEEEDDDDWHSEDAGLDSAITKKNVRVPTTPRKSRAAEVHNLSERRRRDRINEKMKALQELIPRCNKSDKASMLDEAIEYLKSLQLQVQMMSMGSCMMPFGFPGVQQYMSPMLMGMGMGMGMGMDAGLNHQMLPFNPVLAGPSMPNPAAMNLSSRLPMAAFHMPPVSSTDSSTNQATGVMDNALNSSRAQNPNLLQFPNFTDHYPHILGLHPMQVPPCPPRPSATNQGAFGAENPSMPPPNTSKGADSLESNKSR